MTVIRPGSECRVGSNIFGIVRSILIGDTGEMSYLVAWWEDRNRRTEWLSACEVATIDDDDDNEAEVAL